MKVRSAKYAAIAVAALALVIALALTLHRRPKKESLVGSEGRFDEPTGNTSKQAPSSHRITTQPYQNHLRKTSAKQPFSILVTHQDNRPAPNAQVHLLPKPEMFASHDRIERLKDRWTANRPYPWDYPLQGKEPLTADLQGRVFAPLPDGQYYIRASSEDGVAFRWVTRKEARPIIVRLSKSRTIDVDVMSDQGIPCAGVPVCIGRLKGNRLSVVQQSRTDKKGTMRFVYPVSQLLEQGTELVATFAFPLIEPPLSKLKGAPDERTRLNLPAVGELEIVADSRAIHENSNVSV